MAAEALEKMATIAPIIKEANDPQSLVAAIQQGCRAVGFDQFNLTCHVPTSADLIFYPTLSTFPRNFRQHCQREKLDIGTMFTDLGTLQDGAFFWGDGNGPKAAPILEALHHFGLCSGVAVPLNHADGKFSLFMAASAHFTTPRGPIAEAVEILADVSKTRAEILGLCPDLPVEEIFALRSLSSTQKDVLFWIAAGKSNVDIATILGIPLRTIRYHVSEILKKLHVKGRMQAAAIGKASRGIVG